MIMQLPLQSGRLHQCLMPQMDEMSLMDAPVLSGVLVVFVLEHDVDAALTPANIAIIFNLLYIIHYIYMPI